MRVLVTGDVGDGDVVRRALRGVDAIVHTAALHAPHVGFAQTSEFERINVGAPRLLAEQAAAAGIRNLVFTSTTALYGSAAQVIRERVPRLAEAFARRGWQLPDSIDRVCDPGLAMSELGWRPRFGFEEVLKMLDERSSEVLPPERPA